MDFVECNFPLCKNHRQPKSDYCKAHDIWMDYLKAGEAK